MKKLTLLAFCLIGFSQVYGEQKGVPSRYFGFNTNPLLAQVIPFNNINPFSTNASIIVRSYNHRNNGIRAGYGLGLSNDNNFENMFLSLDFDRRREMSPKWLFFQGFGAGLKIVSNNLSRTPPVSISEEYNLGLGWHWGVEYKVNQVFSLSTEATLRFGVRLDTDASFFSLDVPVNIIAHFNIYKRK